MTPNRPRNCGLLLVSGLAGVVAAHAAAFVIVLPDGAQRARYLASTGHGYWPMAVAVAVVTGLVALLWSAWRGHARALGSGLAVATRPARMLLGLTAWQSALFAVMEVGERLAAGVPVTALLHGPEFGAGMAIQVAVAAVVLAVVGAVEEGVHYLVSNHRRRFPRRAPIAGTPNAPHTLSEGAGARRIARAPPLSLPC